MSPLLTWEGTGDVPNFCPNGCGGISEDPYGGPCQACWDAVGKNGGDGDTADGQDCQASHCPPSATQDCDWPRCAGEL